MNRIRSSLVAAVAIAQLAAPVGALASETALVVAGSDWKYLDTGVPPDPAWTTLGYDDSGWLVGPAPLGYGVFDVVTAVGYGPDASDRYLTTWFRQEFVAGDPALFDAISVHLRRDDGAVVYLNGTEIQRSNLPAGPITDQTAALLSLFGAEQDVFVEGIVPDGVLVEGDNVLAVEVHQQSPLSFDLVFDLRLSGWDGPSDVTRGPYLQSTTPTGVKVRWRTDGPSAGRLSWGPEGGPLDAFADDPVVGFEHELAITGMPAGSDVQYAVGTPFGLVLEGDDADHVLRLPPPTGVGVPVRIWALGDSGTADVNAEAVRDAYAGYAPDPLDTDVWLMLGDNAYNSGTLDEYDEAVFQFYPDWLRQVPLWPALGNHESYSSDPVTQIGPYFDLFTLPANGESGGVPSGTESYFSFDYGRIHFVFLDSSGSDRSPTGAMATWCAADLAAVGASDWVIAVFHHPPYSHGSHNSDIESDLAEMRDNFVPLLEAGGVDLVLSGHSHDYERSYLLDGHYGPSDTLTSTMIRQDHDGDPNGQGAYTKWPGQQAPNEGAVYVVAGSSGQASGGLLDYPAMYVSMSELGSMVIDIDGLELEAKFLDDMGAVLDTFAIHKGVTTITSMPPSPQIAASNEVLAMTGLAREPDGDEVPTYSWDFGDGTVSPANPASHAWAAEGAYTVTLTATDSFGALVSDSILVNIDDGEPYIDQIEASADPVEGTPVTFTGHGMDPFGDPLTYVWIIDDVAYEGDIVDHTFADDGTYDAVLQVTDDAGRVVEGSIVVDVANAPPIIESIDVPDAAETEPFTIVATVRDPAGFYDFTTTTWTLPDGSTATGTSVSVTLDDDGPWPFEISARDDVGATTTQTFDVTVRNLPPVIGAWTVDGALEEGGVVTFSAVAVDPSPLDTTSVSWDWGDGTADALGADAVHVFGDDGPWYVTISATDDDGGVGATVIEVDLANLPPAITALDVPADVDEGVPAAFTVRAIDPGYDDALSARWTFDDGAVIDAPGASGGTELGVEHAFPDDGVWSGTVEVTDDEGLGQSLPFTVVAYNLAPRFVSAAPAVRVRPGRRFTYAPEVDDVDPVTFALDGPDGAEVDGLGVVTWTAPDTIGATAQFALTAADDDGGSTTQSWQVIVAEDAPVPWHRLNRDEALACGCAASGPGGAAGWGLGLGLGAWAFAARRRSPR